MLESGGVATGGCVGQRCHSKCRRHRGQRRRRGRGQQRRQRSRGSQGEGTTRAESTAFIDLRTHRAALPILAARPCRQAEQRPGPAGSNHFGILCLIGVPLSILQDMSFALDNPGNADFLFCFCLFSSFFRRLAKSSSWSHEKLEILNLPFHFTYACLALAKIKSTTSALRHVARNIRYRCNELFCLARNSKMQMQMRCR